MVGWMKSEMDGGNYDGLNASCKDGNSCSGVGTRGVSRNCAWVMVEEMVYIAMVKEVVSVVLFEVFVVRRRWWRGGGGVAVIVVVTMVVVVVVTMVLEEW